MRDGMATRVWSIAVIVSGLPIVSDPMEHQCSCLQSIWMCHSTYIKFLLLLLLLLPAGWCH